MDNTEVPAALGTSESALPRKERRLGARAHALTVAVLCCGDRGLQPDDDRGDDVPEDSWLLLEALRALHLDVSRVGWCGAGACGVEARVVLPLGCWDYSDRTDQFRSCIATLASSGAQPQADLRALLRVSIHKSYLLGLEAAGIPVVPTVLLRAGSRPEEIGHALDALAVKCADTTGALDCAKLLTKPALGTRGEGVERVARDTAPAVLFARTRTCDMLVQPWLSRLSIHGELCCVFVNEELLHVVRTCTCACMTCMHICMHVHAHVHAVRSRARARGAQGL